MAAHAFVKLTKEEGLAFQSEGKAWIKIQSSGRLGGLRRIASLKWLWGRVGCMRMANNKCEEYTHGQVNNL